MTWIFVLLLLGFQDGLLKPKDLVWQNRLVIIQGATEPELFDTSFKQEIEERKLLVFWFKEGKLEKTTFQKSIDPYEFLALTEGPGKWVLIGLDGGKKAGGPGVPDFEDLKKIIDAMPMRISEKSKNGG